MTDDNRSFLTEQNLLPKVTRSRSGGDMSDGQNSPSLPSPISANSSAHPDLTLDSLAREKEANIDAIKRRISEISDFYVALPEKFGRHSRIPKLNAMRKDLHAQKAMLSVTVEDGQLISCLERTLKPPRSLPDSITSLLPQPADIDNIRSRLDHIHKLLNDVDKLSDDLILKQDEMSLPLRLRNHPGNFKHGRHIVPSPAAKPRGVVKRRQSNTTKPKTDNPRLALMHIIGFLTIRMEDLQKQCQRLQPLQYDDTLGITSIPEDIELTKAVAVMLCKALCQVCPNKNHIHQVLFSSATLELACDHIGDTAVEFNLAFECDKDLRTWFVVQSTLKGHGDQEMNMEQVEEVARPATHSRPSFSHHLKDSSDATGQPNARFCLQYYKQGTKDLAMELKHSEICEHVVFYPDEERLDVVKQGQAIPLRKLLEEKLAALQMVHIARMLSEAVLKFHSEDWLSCKWDLDNVLIYEMPDGFLEPHLRFELWNPKSAGTVLQHVPRSQKMSHVVSQLGVLLGYLAVGQDSSCANYEEVREVTGSNVYAEIFQTCRDMSRNENGLGDQIMQARFHAKVVAKLAELEDLLSPDSESSNRWEL
ncbi:hypothetical protein N0V82_004473 [Gnomoniopsis sp. IMI 355080]|nr:hypothetical protein N0V82_004473 [Gnomoniopsis sp. IMI 355080]